MAPINNNPPAFHLPPGLSGGAETGINPPSEPVGTLATSSVQPHSEQGPPQDQDKNQSNYHSYKEENSVEIKQEEESQNDSSSQYKSITINTNGTKESVSIDGSSIETNRNRRITPFEDVSSPLEDALSTANPNTTADRTPNAKTNFTQSEQNPQNSMDNNRDGAPSYHSARGLKRRSQSITSMFRNISQRILKRRHKHYSRRCSSIDSNTSGKIPDDDQQFPS